MKIGLSVDLSHPHGLGFYRMLEDLFQGFVKSGHEVYLISCGMKTGRNLKGVTLSYFSSFSLLAGLPFLKKAAKDCLDSLKLDVIHMLDLSYASRVALSYAADSSLPLVFSLNPFELEEMEKSKAILKDTKLTYLNLVIQHVGDEKGILSYHQEKDKDVFRQFGFTESLTLFRDEKELLYVYQRAGRQNL